MLDKMLEFCEYYLENIEENIKKFGKYRTLHICLTMLIEHKKFTKDELRKELSLYIKRIIHQREFEDILNGNEYVRVLYE